MASYFLVLALVPLLGSFITEPAAMTLAALMLRNSLFAASVSTRLIVRGASAPVVPGNGGGLRPLPCGLHGAAALFPGVCNRLPSPSEPADCARSAAGSLLPGRAGGAGRSATVVAATNPDGHG